MVSVLCNFEANDQLGRSRTLLRMRVSVLYSFEANWAKFSVSSAPSKRFRPL